MRFLGHWFLPVLAVWALVLTQAVGQQGILNSSKTEVEKPFLGSKSQFDKFLNGLEQPGNNKADMDVLDFGAKFYAYRLQWPGVKDDQAALAKNVYEFERDVINIILSPNSVGRNEKAKNLLSKMLAERFKEVLKLDVNANRLSVMHAALTLPALARLKTDDIGEVLTELTTDAKYHDAIKLYAFKSMKDYVPVRQFTEDDDPNDKKLSERKKRDVARIKALSTFIEGERKLSNTGEIAAHRFIRREAIESLAQAQVPAVAALKGGKEVEGPVAATLLRVLAKGGLKPEASLAEKIEAAIGVCQFKCASMPAYQPEMGVFLVGRFLDEYSREYMRDFLNLTEGAAAKKKPPVIAWKIHSDRLRAALEDLEKNTKGTPAHAKAVKLAEKAKGFMEVIKDYRRLETPTALRPVADETRPKSTALFKGIKGPEINPPE